MSSQKLLNMDRKSKTTDKLPSNASSREKQSPGGRWSVTSSKKNFLDFDEVVKFPPIPHSFQDVGQPWSNQQSLRNSQIGNQNGQQPVIKDETLQLFDCMPKGLESFLETGPSRRVVDYMDYEKLCTTQRKKVQYLKEQQMPQANRAKDIFEKNMELQEYFINFDIFISDARKKCDRANQYYHACRVANRELNKEIPKGLKQLADMKKIRDGIMRKVIRLQPVENFVERILRLNDSQFPNFTAIIDRNSTLLLTNKYLTKRFTERHLVEKELHEEIQTITNDAKTHDILFRREINTLKKELAKLTRENIDLEQKCGKWMESSNGRLKQVFIMNSSIKNMARIIMDNRPFTAKRMSNLTNPCEIMDMIGLFISDYTDITQAFAERESKVTRTKKKESFTDEG